MNRPRNFTLSIKSIIFLSAKKGLRNWYISVCHIIRLLIVDEYICNNMLIYTQLGVWFSGV